MPIAANRPEALRGRVFRGSVAQSRGLLTKKQLRSAAWVRLRQDVYADAALTLTHRVLMSAVGLTFPAGAGFTGRSAAVLWGVPDLADATDPVEVILPTGVRWNPGEGVRVRRTAAGSRLVRVGGWRCTSRVDTAVELIRHGDVDDAVITLDRVVSEGLVPLLDVREAVEALPPGSRGGAMARKVAALADGHAQSPQETRLRLLLVRAGLPAPVAQYRIFDDEGFVARVDLAYPELRLAIEYDGLWHAERQAFLDDRRRQNRLAAAGWFVLHLTLDDLRHPERLAARIRILYAQRLAKINAR